MPTCIFCTKETAATLWGTFELFLLRFGWSANLQVKCKDGIAYSCKKHREFLQWICPFTEIFPVATMIKEQEEPQTR